MCKSKYPRPPHSGQCRFFSSLSDALIELRCGLRHQIPLMVVARLLLNTVGRNNRRALRRMRFSVTF
ncbi:MAG: hypothetical protein WC965_08505 [Thiohalomonadaceae bacterium]